MRSVNSQLFMFNNLHSMEKIKITIDNTEVEVSKGATIYHAAKQIGIDIPVLCYLNLEHLNIENRPGGCRFNRMCSGNGCSHTQSACDECQKNSSGTYSV